MVEYGNWLDKGKQNCFKTWPCTGKLIICTGHWIRVCNRPPWRYECVFENSFSYFSTKTYVVGTQKNRLNETVLLSTCLN